MYVSPPLKGRMVVWIIVSGSSFARPRVRVRVGVGVRVRVRVWVRVRVRVRVTVGCFTWFYLGLFFDVPELPATHFFFNRGVAREGSTNTRPIGWTSAPPKMS